MVKNIELPEWAITELQELADVNKRPLKLHLEMVLETLAKKHLASKRKSKKAAKK